MRPQSRRVWSSIDITRALLGSYGKLIRNTFESEPVRSALTWLAAQSGPAPDEVATGDFAGWQAMIHKHGAWRAKGGSGSLTRAVASALQAQGGEIVANADVRRVTKNGGRWELQTEAGEFSALCPDRGYLQAAYQDYLAGRPPAALTVHG